MYIYIDVCIYIYINMYVRIRNDGGVSSFARRAPPTLLAPRLSSVRLFLLFPLPLVTLL